MVTQKSQNNLVARVTQNWRKDFLKSGDLKSLKLKENSENQNTEKSTSTWLNVWTNWAQNKNFKTNLLAYEAKQLDENKHMELDDWISQVVVSRSNSMNSTWYLAKIPLVIFQNCPKLCKTIWKYHSWYLRQIPLQIMLLPLLILSPRSIIKLQSLCTYNLLHRGSITGTSEGNLTNKSHSKRLGKGNKINDQ